MSSACDHCPVPGHCCRAITLGYLARDANTIEEAQAEIDLWNARDLDAIAQCGRPTNGFMPFRPMFKTQAGHWVWWCPNLNPKTGRCDDYANRPYACHHYQPKMDALCILHGQAVHFVGFRGEEYWSAVRIWGQPDFVHMRWDQRAQREIAEQDIVIFATGEHDQPASRYNASDLLPGPVFAYA